MARRWMGRLLSAATWTVVLLVLGSSVSLPALGLDEPRLRLSVVAGTSMLPEYEPDDLLLTWRFARYAEGDALVYRVPDDRVGAGIRVVHRVVAVNDGTYTLQGDNNLGDDAWNPAADDVQGRVLAVVPGAGIVLRRILSPLILALASGVLAGAAVWCWCRERTDRDGDHDETCPPRPGDDGNETGATPRRGEVLRRMAAPVVLASLLLIPGNGAAATLGGIDPDALFATAGPARIATSPVTYAQTVTQDWVTGFCVSITVTNRSNVPQTWQVAIPMEAPFDSSTQPSSGQLRTVSWSKERWVVRGPSNAPTLAPGASHTAQWCGTRTPPPVVPGDPRVQVGVRVTPAPNASSSTCVDVDVTTTSPSFVSWEAVIDRATPGLTDPVLWLDAAPSPLQVAVVHAWDAGAGRATFRGSNATNSVVRADTPRTFRYCYPLSTKAPLVQSATSVKVTSTWGTTSFCAEATVVTDSTSWTRWQATVDPSTPGATDPRYRLIRSPDAQGTTTMSFTGNSWTVRGVSHNQFVRAGSPATFTFCQTG